MNNSLKIVYMGTPDFAVEPLAILLKNGYLVKAVVTALDKPAGRGLKNNESAVKKFAISQGIPVMQPISLKEETFIHELKHINPDVIIVVAFRMLPEEVWGLPSRGTINLHASLLPQYRGAAPINWAIINGETETGVTTFFINKEIDTGHIIFSERIPIKEDENAGVLHDNLMQLGSQLILKTVRAIENNSIQAIPQSNIANHNLKKAPKIYKETCNINWNKTCTEIYNLIRGLSPYPAAYTTLISPEGKYYIIKIFKAQKEICKHAKPIGTVGTDQKSLISIAVTDGYVYLQEIQLSGKKKMPTNEFLRGFSINSEWKASML